MKSTVAIIVLLWCSGCATSKHRSLLPSRAYGRQLYRTSEWLLRAQNDSDYYGPIEAYKAIKKRFPNSAEVVALCDRQIERLTKFHDQQEKAIEAIQKRMRNGDELFIFFEQSKGQTTIGKLILRDGVIIWEQRDSTGGLIDPD